MLRTWLQFWFWRTHFLCKCFNCGASEFLEITAWNQHDDVILHTGIEVCLGVTPVGQRLYGSIFKHCWVIFRHTKQNFTLHRGQIMLLHWFLLCSTSKPQVGQARIDGQPETPFTSLKTIFGQVLSISNGLWQPLLSQRSERGAGPFHSLKHCQQNL